MPNRNPQLQIRTKLLVLDMQRMPRSESAFYRPKDLHTLPNRGLQDLQPLGRALHRVQPGLPDRRIGQQVTQASASNPRCVEIPVFMCIKYDDVAKRCLECADEYVMVDHSFTDSATGSAETVSICVFANEHVNCESNLLKIESGSLKVATGLDCSAGTCATTGAFCRRTPRRSSKSKSAPRCRRCCRTAARRRGRRTTSSAASANRTFT